MTTLSNEEVTLIFNLYTNYAKAGIFLLEEYEGVATVTNKLRKYILSVNSDKDNGANMSIDLSDPDVQFIFNTLKVGSQRQPTDVDEFESVLNIHKKLKTIIAERDPNTTTEDDETKSE